MISVSILEYSTSGKWRSRKADLSDDFIASLPPYCYVWVYPPPKPSQSPDILRVVGDRDKYCSEFEAMRRELLKDFDVPRLLGTEMCRASNGFAGCQAIYDDSGRLEAHSKCVVKIANIQRRSSFPSYIWYEMTFFSRWTPNSCVILCLDTPEDLLSRLEDGFLENPNGLKFGDPFAMHVPLIDEIVVTYDQSIWSIRDAIRIIERDRKARINEDPDFSELHEAARHAIHSSETPSVTIETLKELQRQHQKLQEHGVLTVDKGVLDRTQQHLSFQTQLIANLVLRAKANEQRLKNEITLAFNMIAQRDGKVMVEIGKAAKSDSTAMKTIAVVTMAFLPGTFTSAIFSMSFFNFSPGNGSQPNEWHISDDFWIYWTVAIPLTIVTMLVWFAWQYGKNPFTDVAGVVSRRRRLAQERLALEKFGVTA